VAFITQSQSYDPWSNVNAGSEYQLSGIQGDRYLVSGKENDSVTGNTLLDWRDYDSVTGRMNSFDPDGSEGGQISLSPFAYSWNRPSMLNDPDGRCPMCIGFMIGIFTSAIGNMASGKMPSSIGQFLLPGLQGAIGGGIASAIGGAFAGMGSFAGKGLLQAGTHALSGGLQSAAFGGNFWQGAASSGISSGFASGSDGLGLGGLGQLLGGGLSGGLSSELFGGNFWDGARDGVIVSGLNHLSHGGGFGDDGKAYKNLGYSREAGGYIYEVTNADGSVYQNKSRFGPQGIQPVNIEFDIISMAGTLKAGYYGLKGAFSFAKGGKSVLTASERIGKNGKAVEVIFKDGSKMDVNAARVKEWIPNLNPNAPAGTLQKVKFDNFIPGSKGYKRFPTKSDINFLNSF
jgi:RHS repeat-associated protein